MGGCQIWCTVVFSAFHYQQHSMFWEGRGWLVCWCHPVRNLKSWHTFCIVQVQKQQLRCWFMLSVVESIIGHYFRCILNKAVVCHTCYVHCHRCTQMQVYTVTVVHNHKLHCHNLYTATSVHCHTCTQCIANHTGTNHVSPAWVRFLQHQTIVCLSQVTLLIGGIVSLCAEATNYSNGWCLIGDVLLALPLSLFCQIIRFNFRVSTCILVLCPGTALASWINSQSFLMGLIPHTSPQLTL